MGRIIEHIVPAGPAGWLSNIVVDFYGPGIKARWKEAFTTLARFNGMADPHWVFAGQTLHVPADYDDLLARVKTGRLATAGFEVDPEALTDDPAALAIANAPVAGAPLRLYLPAGRGFTSGFGPRAAIPGVVGAHFHPGCDASWWGCGGYLLRALADGVVTAASDTGNGYGVHVIVDGRPGPVYLLAHLPATRVAVGQTVVAGQTILGAIGSTGMSSGDHLHLEVQRDPEEDGWSWGASVDPAEMVSIVAAARAAA